MDRPRSPLTDQIRRGLREPHLVVRQLNEWWYDFHGTYLDDTDRLSFFDAEWDTLLLLDACRYDTFAAIHDLPGTLEARRTASSSTIEFLKRYVDGRELTDTVYVTANPQHYRKTERGYIDGAFHDVIEVWQEDGWDDSYRTVRPETVADAAEAAADRYPNKRLLVHFMQPHYPYIGPTGRDAFDNDSLDFFNRVLTGEIEVEDGLLRQAYRENLQAVLPSVERLLGSLSGRSVVSADHGEMFGERAFPIPIREYGHPTGIHTPELTEVPWLVSENGPRRTIQDGEPADRDEKTAMSRIVADRLRDLGYV